MNRWIALFSLTCCIALALIAVNCERRDVEEIEAYDPDLDGVGLAQTIPVEAEDFDFKKKTKSSRKTDPEPSDPKDPKPKTNPGDIVFSSDLELVITGGLEDDDQSQPLGRTPSDQYVVIPKGYKWSVVSIGPVDMQALIQEVVDKDIPGLVLKDWRSGDLIFFRDMDLPKLAELAFVGENFTDDSFEHIAGLTNLEVLVVLMSAITDDGLINISSWSHLQSLSLKGSKITDAGLEHLTELTGLKELDLRETQVTETGVENLKQALPNLTIESDF